MRSQALSIALVSTLISSPSLASSEKISNFAKSVSKHVLMHELAHALIREFSLPVLGNEEVLADSFATVWITQNWRDEAPAILGARIRSWIYEDQETDPKDYDHKGEHPLDIRRAYQAACLLYGSDPADWARHISWLDIKQYDLDDCSDTAPDQMNGWNSVLKAHLLPENSKSPNVELIFGEGPMKDAMMDSGVMQDFEKIVRRFDWPQQITLHFDHCPSGAFWDRSDRLILLCDSYVQRFIDQGHALSGWPGR